MINRLLPTKKSRAQKKKFRGQNRYFKKLFEKAASLTIDIGDSDWYDQWHSHIDWDGYGNLRWRFRLLHLQALAVSFKRCAEQLEHFRKPYQLYLYLNSGNSQDDGVFLHTENPNRSEFPCIFEDSTWSENEVSGFFQELLPEYSFRAGTQCWQGQQIYLIYAKGIGIPIEAPNQEDTAGRNAPGELPTRSTTSRAINPIKSKRTN